MNKTGTDRKNSGLSLIELIIVIAIMAILVGILSPMFVKYVDRSRKAKDIYTADQIARAVNIAFVEYPDAYSAYQSWKSAGKTLYVNVNGRREKDEVYLVASSGQQTESNMQSNCFNGTTEAFWKEGKVRRDEGKKGGTGFYGVINRELGLSTTEMNSSIIPKFQPAGTVIRGTLEYCDRYRIVKRKDNGMMEIWIAQPDPGGGNPIYRIWPEPDDIYRN